MLCCCLAVTTTKTTTATAFVSFKTIKAVANLMHNYLHLQPVENDHCAGVPCGVYGQCDGVSVWRLKPLNVSAYFHSEETQVSCVERMFNLQAATRVNYKDFVECCHQVPMTMSVFGSLQERVRCVFPRVFLGFSSVFFSLRVDYDLHVDVVCW